MIFWTTSTSRKLSGWPQLFSWTINQHWCTATVKFIDSIDARWASINHIWILNYALITYISCLPSITPLSYRSAPVALLWLDFPVQINNCSVRCLFFFTLSQTHKTLKLPNYLCRTLFKTRETSFLKNPFLPFFSLVYLSWIVLPVIISRPAIAEDLFEFWWYLPDSEKKLNRPVKGLFPISA